MTTTADLHAEQAVIGALLLDREAIVPVAERLEPAHFQHAPYAAIYDAVRACYLRRVPPDLITVKAELERRGVLAEIGGFEALADLSNTVPTAYHIEAYAAIVEQAAIRRALRTAGERISALAAEDAIDTDALLSDAYAVLSHADTRRIDDGLLPAAVAADDYEAELEAVINGTQPARIETGIADLDRLTRIRPGHLVVIGARLGVGKSALMMQIAYALITRGDRCGVFSLEMERTQIIQRLVCLDTRIDFERLTTYDLSTEELHQIHASLYRIRHEYPLHIDHTGGQSLEHITLRARRAHARYGPFRMIVVDYLQLVRGARQRNDTREQEVAHVSRGLKALAKDLNCPIIALAQLNRGAADTTPSIVHIRESDAIAQDADLVILVHRDDDPTSDKAGLAELHVKKQRDGKTGVVTTVWDGEHQRFYPFTAAAPEGY